MTGKSENEFDEDAAREIFGDEFDIDRLPKSGVSLLTNNDRVASHDGDKILIPASMNPVAAVLLLVEEARNAVIPTTWDKQFDYRPEDGAVAAMRVLRRRYKIANNTGTSVPGFLGPMEMPAEEKTIKISLTESVNVPWGTVVIPELPGLELMFCDHHRHPVFGKVFELHVSGPKMYSDEVKKIFDEIEAELIANSIYKGQAMSGTTDLTFYDLSGFNANEVVFSDDITRTISAKVWYVLRHPEVAARKRVSLKRSALFKGGFGGGKTSATIITAQIAVENGWTVFFAKTSEDINQVILNSRRYRRVLVIIEDVDRQAATQDDNRISQLLETFDGVDAKGGEFMVILTTNRDARISQGMRRPGRVDAEIDFGLLDRPGTERLVRAVIPSHELGDIDFDAFHEAVKEYMPAFVREVIASAQLFALDARGEENFLITTEDLTAAAKSLRSQWEDHQAATDLGTEPEIETALRSLVTDTIARVLEERLEGAQLTQRGVYVGDIELANNGSSGGGSK